MLGHHFHKSNRNTLADAIAEDIKEFNAECGQIFLSNNRSGVVYKNPGDLASVSTVPIYVHGAYTNSLWTKSKSQHVSIKKQMEMCEELSYGGLIFHHGKKTPAQIVAGLNAQPESKTPILLEQSACKPSEHPAGNPRNNTHETPEKLNILIDMLREKAKREWGIVIDTAHLWAMGTDVSTSAKMREFLEAITYPEHITLLHFNGSYSKFKSGKDKHAIPAEKEDNIWNRRSRDGWREMMKWAKENNKPMVMEINRGSTDDIKYIYREFAN